MSNPLRILCVHGVGQQDASPEWRAGWTDAISAGVGGWSPGRKIETSFVAYEDLFARAPLTLPGIAVAIGKLLASGVWHGVGDLFHRPRGISDLPERLRWTAGMIVQWVENEKLRVATRGRIIDAVREHEPDVICAHSLGSLIAYDALIRESARARSAERTFVSFGSQIGNPFVRGTFGGRLVCAPVKRWRHLHNRYDDIFTATIRLQDSTFEQVETPFDIQGFADHDAVEYLSHPSTINSVWREVAGGAGTRAITRSVKAVDRASKRPPRRALLVGINRYPDPADRLDGCVNDVFLMSSILQDSGFLADEIRVVLDGRATSQAILDRLEWLLDGAEDGAQRVFYYSGHGAQLPVYESAGELERVDECLVPYDFDWSRDSAITDDRFFDLYSQLPYGAHFVAIFDCCHSGGMTRQGGQRVRGITPPDDIRHRMLRWESEYQMWVPRDFKRTRETIGYARNRPDYTGATGTTYRLGRSVALRRLERPGYVRVRRELKHEGPYLPVIVQACAEQQLSFEYRHGVTSFGAFTYSLGEVLRHQRATGRALTFEGLVASTSVRLKELEYDQTPQLIGPKTVLKRRLPWLE